jgi:GTPase SAR1 family protein
MGNQHVRSIPENNYVNIVDQKSRRLPLPSFHRKVRSSIKRKVLVLGLDGVGKTDLFTRIIRHYKEESKMDFLAGPTMGK